MRVVLAHGVFDLLHSGHVAHLMQARSFGDYLIVSVLADDFVVKKRGVINEQIERMFMVSCLKCVDKVVLCEATGPQDLLRKLRPAIYVRNDEYITRLMPEYEVAKELGIEVGFTRTMPPHTSDLVSKIMAKNQ